MRLVLISDTHGMHPETLPKGDVLVHAGDLCRQGTLAELSSAISWLRHQPFEYVVCIGGNHDYPLEAFMKENEENMLREKAFGSVIYLRDREVMIGGKKFYGAPWTPRHEDGTTWAFGVKRGPDMAEKWKLIPDDTNVLITHCPPYGVLDYFGSKRLGCEDLFERVDLVRPQVHVFGHVHNAYGERFDDRVPEKPVKFFNACTTQIKRDSNGDSFYSKLLNEPFVIEI